MATGVATGAFGLLAGAGVTTADPVAGLRDRVDVGLAALPVAALTGLGVPSRVAGPTLPETAARIGDGRGVVVPPLLITDDNFAETTPGTGVTTREGVAVTIRVAGASVATTAVATVFERVVVSPPTAGATVFKRAVVTGASTFDTVPVAALVTGASTFEMVPVAALVTGASTFETVPVAALVTGATAFATVSGTVLAAGAAGLVVPVVCTAGVATWETTAVAGAAALVVPAVVGLDTVCTTAATAVEAARGCDWAGAAEVDAIGSEPVGAVV
jgi:hypothetical protein